MLWDRFGALKAIANSSIKLARMTPEEELPMESLVPEAILEFADGLRKAGKAVAEWKRLTDILKQCPSSSCYVAAFAAAEPGSYLRGSARSSDLTGVGSPADSETCLTISRNQSSASGET